MRNIKALFLTIVFLAGCDTTTKQSIKTPPKMTLVGSSFNQLPSWGNDDFKNFAAAFEKSCAPIQKRDASRPFGVLKEAGTHGDWQPICTKFKNLKTKNTATLKTFFENHFTPHAVLEDNKPFGLFTGYYEASLNGSHTRQGKYQTPLHLRPEDLVMVNLGEFRDTLKGQRIAGRIKNGTLKPYESREEIIEGRWPHDDETLVWVDSPVDAFFVQIQGSGVVTFDDGSTMRIGYAGQNGHPYYAIGRELIKRGALTKETVSMQSIRAWLESNPAQANEIMNTNASYVFFRKIEGQGPVGAQGVALTAGRSIAVDRTKISYGIPIWVDLENPEKDAQNLQRLMVSQDTGGAIIGAVRGDYFWGYGDKAEKMAGHMKSQGRYWVLLPKNTN